MTVGSLVVAKYFGVSPEEIDYQWTNIDFLDREEFMRIQTDVEAQYYKWCKSRPGKE